MLSERSRLSVTPLFSMTIYATRPKENAHNHKKLSNIKTNGSIFLASIIAMQNPLIRQ